MDPKVLINPTFIVLLATAIAAVTDLRSFKVHNLLTLPLIVSGVLYHAINYHAVGLAESLGGACFGGGALLIAYLLGGVGAGDVKLMAGVGAWLGWPGAFFVLLASFLAAGIYALALQARYGGLDRTISNLKVICYQLRALGAHLGPEDTAESLLKAGESPRLIPYATMIVVGIISWIFLRG